MKKIAFYISSIFVLPFIMSACSGDDVLTPGDVPFVDPFIIPADKTDQESVLRRGFYERTGIHLILRDEVGKTLDADGNPYTEMINLSWNLTGKSAVQIYDILTPEQQPKAVEILEKDIVPHICGPNNNFFSIYPVADYYNQYKTTYMIFSNIRCTLLNMKNILKAKNDTEVSDALVNLLYNIGSEMVSRLSSDVREPFYSVSEKYHGEYIYKDIPAWENKQDIKYLYELGFINYNEDFWGDVIYDRFPSSSSDFSAFVEFALKNPEGKIRSEFADYPLVIAKYELIRSIIEKAGYIF